MTGAEKGEWHCCFRPPPPPQPGIRACGRPPPRAQAWEGAESEGRPLTPAELLTERRRSRNGSRWPETMPLSGGWGIWIRAGQRQVPKAPSRLPVNSQQPNAPGTPSPRRPVRGGRGEAAAWSGQHPLAGVQALYRAPQPPWKEREAVRRMPHQPREPRFWRRLLASLPRLPPTPAPGPARGGNECTSARKMLQPLSKVRVTPPVAMGQAGDIKECGLQLSGPEGGRDWEGAESGGWPTTPAELQAQRWRLSK